MYKNLIILLTIISIVGAQYVTFYDVPSAYTPIPGKCTYNVDVVKTVPANWTCQQLDGYRENELWVIADCSSKSMNIFTDDNCTIPSSIQIYKYDVVTCDSSFRSGLYYSFKCSNSITFPIAVPLIVFSLFILF
ncbi:Transmembrane domain-containing protein [Orpheovirus IHUMI-LCC2]|uniref:Transmembrane domain-containing protein n=1 Tax=Orpheovirus IHUMI-LCC2 TaxID=2023057 RepID=A0A2I2L528_9VIRU|nr:Transmembrane domain-containing protein [Orpheovirus IHUMI-LCC2]SNW62634.1 Transmembrane domain-containing protein [Orpheovirus IHUMI-LCC2]